MTQERTITLLMPTYNEVDGLTATLKDLDQTLVDKVLIVDAGSTDGTLELAARHNVEVVMQRRKGLAFAVFDAINDNIDTDCVIEFSPDGNCMCDQLPELVAKIREGYDLAVVSRYLPPAKSYDDTPISAFGNWMFTKLFSSLGKFPVTDSLTIYRGFDCNIAKTKEFEKLLYGPVFEPLVTAMAQIKGMKIVEIPGDEPERIGGETKRSIIYNGSCCLLMWFRSAVYKLTKLAI
ncbi:glycosyltransferase family 2 protein [Pseudodesulfovibrio sp.]|nr:glycosyltransferase family 2 protein [Pseudodesulfovibrio sp.]